MIEKMQTVKMCIQTYLNLYGQMPTINELSQQLDTSYLQLIQSMLSEYATA